MSASNTNLESKIDTIESKADRYQTATNFEAKKQEYLNDLSAIDQSLSGLERRLNRMEFFTAVLIEVVEAQESAPAEVEDARSRAQKIIEYDAADYYELIDQEQADQYKQRIQQTKTTINDAIKLLESELRTVEDTWTNKVQAARNVQRLFGDARDMSDTFTSIEAFVSRRMQDDSESITTLKGEWQGLRKDWERSGADWDTFQQEYELSDHTIEILKELATGEDIPLTRLNKSTIGELLDVEDLQDVAKLTI